MKGGELEAWARDVEAALLRQARAERQVTAAAAVAETRGASMAPVLEAGLALDDADRALRDVLLRFLGPLKARAEQTAAAEESAPAAPVGAHG